MDAREQRGLVIAAKCRIKKNGDNWLVPSQSSGLPTRYSVYRDGDRFRCTCPDHEICGHNCKHIHAVKITIEREECEDGAVIETVTMTETIKRKTYPQNWRAYNAAQTHEKSTFLTLLRDLCKGIKEPPPSGRGRPTIPLADAIFAAVYKVYSTVPGRRFMSDLRDAHDKGLIRRLPCYNSIFNVLEDEATFEILKRLVEETAAPAKGSRDDLRLRFVRVLRLSFRALVRSEVGRVEV